MMIVMGILQKTFCVALEMVVEETDETQLRFTFSFFILFVRSVLHVVLDNLICSWIAFSSRN